MINYLKPAVRNNSKMAMLGILFLILLGTSVFAQEAPGFYERQQVGLRLGPWLNQGGLPVDTSAGINTDVGDNSFYAELYGAWRIFDRGFVELSLGFANRGDLTTVIFPGTDSSIQFYGNLVVYPISVQLKYYLPGFRTFSFKPFMQAGAGVFIGRHSVTFTDSYYTYVKEPSATSFSYTLGAGFDWPLSNSIAIELNTRYFPIDFGNEGFFGESDYSAVTATVGVKYMFIPTKKTHGKRPKR